MSRLTAFLCTAVSLFCLSAQLVMGQASDQVFLVRGVPLSGFVTSTSPTEVTINVRGSDQKVAVNEIKYIIFSDDGPELRKSRNNVMEGQLENGLSELRRIDAAAIKRDLVRQDLEFYIAFCEARLALSGGGDKNAARANMLNFVRSASTSFHFFETAELLGDLSVGLEDYEGAVRYYSAISSKAPWPDYQMKASVLEARALEAQGKYAEAVTKYDGVIASTVDTAEAIRQKRLATVGRALGLAEAGKATEAIAILNDTIAKNDPQDSELFARTYNALGRAYLKSDQIKEALRAYLHVDLLFYGQSDAHAESLYFLSKLWGQVNKSDRAVAARALLTERYGGSAWAKRQ